MSGAATAATLDRVDPQAAPEVEVPGSEAAPSATRRARAIKTAGLWLAPVMIALLALLFFLYYRGLEADGNSTVISALNWNDKLLPQTIRIVYIAFWSTVIVILVAVPLGILLTRPAVRKISPFVLAVANSGQALPAKIIDRRSFHHPSDPPSQAKGLSTSPGCSTR